MLGFQRLPRRALRTVAEVLDRDDAFRRRVADGLDEDEPDRASWLFLTRPDGWGDELAVLGDGAAEQRAEKERRSAERRVEQLSAALERRDEEVEDAHTELESARAELAEERRRRHEAQLALQESAERIEVLGEQRARAVRELKRSELLAAERLEHLRAVEADLLEVRAQLEDLGPVPVAEAPTPPPVPGAPTAKPPALPLGEVATAVDGAARSATELANALAEVAALLARTTEVPAASVSHGDRSPSVASASSAAPEPAGRSGSRPARRVPLRTLRGVVEDSPEGIEQLMGTDGLVTLVDGYNVAMGRWPELDKGAQRDSLVRALGGLAARVGAVVHVVFDGGDHGQRPAVGVPLPVRIHFSPTGVEADDVILSMVAELPADSPVLVISSDRRVARGSRRLGANTAASETLVELLGR